MLRVIVESPYAGDIARNVDYARRCLRHCLDRGESPYASHLLYTQPGVLEDSILDERLKGIQAGYTWMPVADIVAFYVDLGWSAGMLQALKVARVLHWGGKFTIEARSLEQPLHHFKLPDVGEVRHD